MINVNLYRQHTGKLITFINTTKKLYKTPEQAAVGFSTLTQIPLVAAFHLHCEQYECDKDIISKINKLLTFYNESLVSDIKLPNLEYRS